MESLLQEVDRVLQKHGLSTEQAASCAAVFCGAQRDGIYSHGLARVSALVAAIESGDITVGAAAAKVSGSGALEQWDGRHGLGITNAQACMARAVELARTHGIGAVAIRNTNHWMRAGHYGLQAADGGCIGICWTNTCPLMTPWGSATGAKKLGNNPLVVAIPREPDEGGHLLLDMAMSQYALGKLELARQAGERLAVPGGYDSAGRLTDDPAEIYEQGDVKSLSYRAVAMGYWKGAGLALALDAIAVGLSGGNATHQISPAVWAAGAVSQVFIAIDPHYQRPPGPGPSSLEAVLADLARGEGGSVRYPGEQMVRVREASACDGCLVDPAVWAALQTM
jgi:3-dehydro-L-gulonate 2-dehydrogenase